MSNSPPSHESLIDVENLTVQLRRFADDRDWGQFHSPKNLAIALTGEVGELVEVFQWMSEADSLHAGSKPELAHAIGEEMADVLFYLVRLADVLGIDLDLYRAAKAKLLVNAQKYPAEQSKGSSEKRYLAAKARGQS